MFFFAAVASNSATFFSNGSTLFYTIYKSFVFWTHLNKPNAASDTYSAKTLSNYS